MLLKNFSLKKKLAALVLGLCLAAGSLPAWAGGMQEMSEAEMAEVSAGSFSEFSIENDQARLWLNVNAETWAEVDRIQASQHSDAWDQNWHNTQLGADGDYLQMQGFVLEAQFDDINSDSRQLQTLRMGFEEVSGTMQVEDMQSFSGRVGGSRYYRSDMGQSEITFDKDKMMMIMDTGEEYDQPGMYMDFGDAEIQ